IEAAIGMLGIAVLYAVPYLTRFYGEFGGAGLQGFLLRGLVCAVCLLPPTILMGSTLPVIAREVQAAPEGVAWLGFLYGANIVGGVFGCLSAGFYFLRVHDMRVATYVAVGFNITVAV